jgi:Dyp-type peroxidase family
MRTHLLDLLDNRYQLIEETQDRQLGDSEYTELFKDLQSNILTANGSDRAHYFFVAFDEKDPDMPVTRYLLGLLAHTAFEREMIRAAIEDPAAQEKTSPALRKAAAAWVAGAPAQITTEQHDLLADLQVVSEYDVYWRRADARKASQAVSQAAASPSPSVRPTANVLLTRSAYDKLKLPPPDSEAFQGGPDRDGSLLKPSDSRQYDPDKSQWDAIDALIILAFDPSDARSLARREKQVATLREVIESHARLLFEETGNVLRAKSGQLIEPFGFRDGISQPVFYASHLASLFGDGTLGGHPDAGGGNSDPRAPLKLALCPDPHGKRQGSCGSYFVFRKLEQDLEGFRTQAERLSAGKGWTPEEMEERFVGRKRSGDPIVPGARGLNDFDYAKDGYGATCPFTAHVRKANPRSDVVRSYHAPDNRIVRRGMPYGPAISRDERGAPIYPLTYRDGDEGPIGMLFMCAQSSIADQFEHIQTRWADKPDHPRGTRTGVDTLAGQLASGQRNRIAIDPKGQPTTAGLDSVYDPVVTLRGSAYLFAPSISFLRALVDDLLSTTN